MEIIERFIAEKIVDLINSILNASVEHYNIIMKNAIDLLKQSPENWNGGSGWSLMNTVNTGFIALGSTLMVIFWLIKLCEDNLDIRAVMRPETMIKELTILVIGEWFVVSSFKIFASLFGIVDYLTKAITPTSSSANITLPGTAMQYINSLASETDPKGMEALFVLMLTAIVLLFYHAIPCVVCYYAYIRMFKVLIVAPYGSLVTSTFAGSHGIKHSTVSFFKYALTVLLEAVTMLMIIRLASVLISSGNVSIIPYGEISDLGSYIAWMVQSICLMLVMVGGIKESSIITQRIIGS